MSVAVTRIVTSAILQATSWTQEFATSPARSACSAAVCSRWHLQAMSDSRLMQLRVLH